MIINSKGILVDERGVVHVEEVAIILKPKQAHELMEFLGKLAWVDAHPAAHLLHPLYSALKNLCEDGGGRHIRLLDPGTRHSNLRIGEIDLAGLFK